MKFKSHYPPVCIQGPVSGQWYIIANGLWNPVERKYGWNELEKMWDKTKKPKVKETKPIVKKYKVKGSKDNVYNVINDDGFWSCSCPAHGFSRGKDCKHITELKKKTK